MSPDERNLEFVCWIRVDADITLAVHRILKTLSSHGVERDLAQMIATAASELCRNIIRYASYGSLSLHLQKQQDSQDCWLVAEDVGPGIHNVADAMTDGYSTGGFLGLGLPGVARMMDEVVVCPDYDAGARILARKRVG